MIIDQIVRDRIPASIEGSKDDRQPKARSNIITIESPTISIDKTTLKPSTSIEIKADRSQARKHHPQLLKSFMSY